jgi:hypothetical protein
MYSINYTFPDAKKNPEMCRKLEEECPSWLNFMPQRGITLFEAISIIFHLTHLSGRTLHLMSKIVWR